MFNTDDFFKENPIEPETVFEHTEPVISIDDLIGTPVHGLFIKSKINSAFDWGTRSVLWKRELNKEIARLRKAAFSDEAQRVIQMGLITSKIEEISSYVPCIVVDDERSQWEDEQRAKRAKADEAKTTRFWEQYKERQAKGQTADDDDCNPPIPQSIENDSAGSQDGIEPASATKPRRKWEQEESFGELKQGLREIWEKEDRPDARLFFPTKLKKYINTPGSPVTAVYPAGKDAGIGFKLSTGTTGHRTKKTISNYVSIFKKTP
jgi:hypothetical protein